MKSQLKFETHPHLPSGKWEGFYTQYGVKSKMECVLEFRNQQIRGYGSDDIGTYTWEGQYDLEKGSCSMIKQYLGAHSVYYKGDVDENGIWGSWKLSFSSGGFHLWPKARKNRNTETEKVSISIKKPQTIVL